MQRMDGEEKIPMLQKLLRKKQKKKAAQSAFTHSKKENIVEKQKNIS
jgi:hypothetical protein